MTAYQITSMMEGVVQGGTAIVVKEVGKPIAGKTGTTNDAKDAWFIGFSPDIVVGIYLGFDKPRPLGKGNAATGGRLAAPIARDFLKLALADKAACALAPARAAERSSKRSSRVPRHRIITP
jgi:penicillin-binding protein 1A